MPEQSDVGRVEPTPSREMVVTPVATTRIVPKTILPVTSMEPAASFYRRLGFDVQSYDSGYAWVLHDGEEIVHLRVVVGLDAAANASSCYLHVGDAGRWHAAWIAAGVSVGPLEDQSWGMREFAVADPSGNLIRVGQNI